MKNLLILFAFFTCLYVKAQKENSIVLNGYSAYIFQERVESDNYTEYAKEGLQYGMGMEYFFQRNMSLEVKYLRQDTQFPLYGTAGEQLNEGRDKGSVNYFMVGATSYYGGITSQAKVWPFGGVGLGVGIVDPKDGERIAKFAWDAKFGLRIKTSSKLSFKLQATFQSITSGIRSHLYVTPVAPPLVLPDYDTLFQFGLGGGLCFSL